jgi:hypothetical protein
MPPAEHRSRSLCLSLCLSFSLSLSLSLSTYIARAWGVSPHLGRPNVTGSELVIDGGRVSKL